MTLKEHWSYIMLWVENSKMMPLNLFLSVVFPFR